MKKVSLLAAPTLVAGLLFAVPGTANAYVVDQACLVNEVVYLDPPLKNDMAEVNVTVHGNLHTCTSKSANTGTYTEHSKVPNPNCTSLFAGASGTRVFDWTNSVIPNSTFTYNRTTQRVEGGSAVITFLGQISAGTFYPDSAKLIIAAVMPDVTACNPNGPGISRLVFNGTLTIGLLSRN